MLILSIETSTPVCSVAVHRDGCIEAIQEFFIGKTHSNLLIVSIDFLLRSLSYGLSQIDALALSSGPGSYTGLRIGSSTAKGICYSAGIPLIAVPTLEALAWQLKPFLSEGDIVVPMLDARRMEVYSCIMSDRMELIDPVKPVILDEKSFIEHLNRSRVWFNGNSTKKASSVIVHPNACFVPQLPSARTIGQLACEKFQNSDFVDLAYFEPFYLKEFYTKAPKNLLL